MDFNVEFALKAVENFLNRQSSEDEEVTPYEVVLLTYHTRGADWEANLCSSKKGFHDRSFWVKYNAIEDTAELTVYKMETSEPIRM